MPTTGWYGGRPKAVVGQRVHEAKIYHVSGNKVHLSGDIQPEVTE
jgi:hypothetical protein